MRFRQLILGPQPLLRLIALLLAVIAAMLVLIHLDIRALPDPPDPCGNGGNPCSVVIDH